MLVDHGLAETTTEGEHVRSGVGACVIILDMK